MARHEVIVVGLGAVGAATLRALAVAGRPALGIDQYEPPHAFGSSHGSTRITRLAVGEGAAYAPLVARSHQIWRELEAETHRELMVQCGGLVMGVPGAAGQHGVVDFVGHTREVAESAGVAHEVLTAAEVRRRYPVLGVTTESACFEPTAGYLRAEECVRAQLESAVAHGAEVRVREQVLAWAADRRGVRVATTAGEHLADALVIAAGPYVGELAFSERRRFSVHRQVLYWFEMSRHQDLFAALPVFIWMHGTGPGQFVYGFPAVDGPAGGLKIAREDFSNPLDPRFVDRTVSPAETAAMYEESVAPLFADLSPRCVRAEVCLYTVTPDFGFVIDRLAGEGRVVLASPCSGHGFKHSAAVGEAAARLALDEDPGVDLRPFSLAR